MKSLFSWLNGDKELETLKVMSTPQRRVRPIIEKENGVTMETIKEETAVSVPSYAEEILVQTCTKCSFLCVTSELSENFICQSCYTHESTMVVPSQECLKCHESFVVSEITEGYICEPCQIFVYDEVNGANVWDEDWDTDEELNANKGYDDIPAPPPLPKPYVPRGINNERVCKKLFVSPSKCDVTLNEIESKSFVDVIDWDKITDGWNQLYEDCKIDTLSSESFCAPSNEMEFEFTWPPAIWSEPLVPDWDYQQNEKYETSSEEYFFPKGDKENMLEQINSLITDIENLPDTKLHIPMNEDNEDNEDEDENEDDESTEFSETISYSEDSEIIVIQEDNDCSESTDPEGAEGTLELILGPMYSGKSTAALLKLAQMADIGFDVLYINHADDIRVTEAQDGVVSTHNSQYKSLSKKINSQKVSELKWVNVRKYQYVGVDEGQFFPDLYETVLKWVTVYGKNVIVSSLDGDAYRRKFGQVLDLIPSADSVTKLKAYCDKCREKDRKIKPAPFTARMCKKTDAKLVGGRDLYVAMCRECHDRHLTDTAI